MARIVDISTPHKRLVAELTAMYYRVKRRTDGKQLRDKSYGVEEQITKMKDLIGYQEPPKFKLLKGGLE
jgi:hypothetical protein